MLLTANATGSWQGTNKKLHEKFRGSSSHAIVASQFIAVLNVFFDKKSEIYRKFLRRLYRNLTVAVLSTNDGSGFSYEQLTNISAEINIMLRNLAKKQKIKQEEADEKIEKDLEDKFNLPESSPRNENDQIEIFDDNLNVELNYTYPMLNRNWEHQRKWKHLRK